MAIEDLVTPDFLDLVYWHNELKNEIVGLKARVLNLENGIYKGLDTDISVINYPEELPEDPAELKEGDTYMWSSPISGVKNAFLIRRIYVDQVFSNPDSALLAETYDSHSNSVFINCRFAAGRYAFYGFGQTNLVFINCTFTDHIMPRSGGGDESTVRMEDNCRNIFFKDCVINSFGQKHAFRIHGECFNICAENLRIRSEGNGMMLGRYLGSSSNGIVNGVEFKNVVLEQRDGNDCFDPKRDGSLVYLRIEDMRIYYGRNAWDSPSDVVASHPDSWTIVDLQSFGPDQWSW